MLYKIFSTERKSQIHIHLSSIMKNCTKVPKVSILLPVYNAANWLRDCLNSISQQTFHDFEIIAVNDGSTDDSLSILYKFQQFDKRIQVHTFTENQGIVAALNTAFDKAEGEFIARMDADDIMPADRLKLQTQYLLEHTQAGVVSGRVEYLGDSEANLGYYRYVQWLNSIYSAYEIRLRRFIESPVAHPSVMMRRNILPKTVYRKGNFPEDYDLWLRLLESGAEIHKIDEVVLRWRDHPERISRTNKEYDREYFFEHKAQFIAAEIGRLKPEKILAWAGGRKTRRRIDFLRKFGIEMKGYIDVHPRRINTIIQGLPVISPENIPWQSDILILVFVPNWGARDEITRFLVSQGAKEGEQFLLCA